MAQQDITIGAADQGNGDTLFAAFTKVQANFDELYLDDAGDVNSVTAGSGISVNQTTGAVIVTNDTPNADHTGEVTGSAALTITDGVVTNAKMAANSIDSDQYVDGSIDTIHIADDQVTHAKLEDRYTAIQDIATTTGTIDLEADKYAAFNLTGNLGTVTLDIHDIKTGQVIDIILSGTDLSSAAITLGASVPFTTVSINKVGSTSIDTAAKNIIQVLCVDDTVGDAILTWAVASYGTGTTV